MRKFITAVVILAGGILIILTAGCYSPGGAVPEEGHPAVPQAWTAGDVDAAVSMTLEKIHSPAPTESGIPPQECNYIQYLRFKPVEGSENPQDADAIIVLSPGLLGGAGSLEGISRQLVYMALEQRGINLEVWAIDRRANNLEDLTGLNAAEEAHDTQIAVDYIYNGAEIDGRKFAGFLTGNEEPYLSEFGLELIMRDLYTVITTNVPDPEMRRQKVFVGGHSLGGILTAMFAAWDFDGDPATLEDAGYMNCAGLIALDSVLYTGVGYTKSYVESFYMGLAAEDVLGEDIPSDAAPEDADELYTHLLQSLRDGSLPRILNPVLMLVCPEFFALMEPLAMEAAWRPDEESDLLHRIPYNDGIPLTFLMLHSKDFDNFIYHAPSIRDFRFTNEALFGIIMDDNFQPVNPLQTSIGFLGGGAVAEKQFPLPQDWANLPELSILKSGFNMDGQFIANDAGPSLFELGSGPLYTWINFDEIGDEADPDLTDASGTLTFTTTREEVTDIRDAARFMYTGPTNALEWYFPTRTVLDMMMAVLVQDWGPEHGITLLHQDKVAGMPQITFMAEKGPFIGLTEPLVDYFPPEVIVLEGYNHLDVCVAAPDRPSRRQNEVNDLILDFVIENL